MFIGHFAVGMAGKRIAPRVSLPMLFIAAQLADILWPIFVALGIETVRIEPGNTAYTPLNFVSYPWSHSLLMLCVWGLLLGLLYRSRTGDKRGALVLGALVVSHWVLDWISHRADMPLWPGSTKVGLGLWNHVIATIAVEIVLFAIGVAIYEGTTRGRNRRGQIGFWAMVVLLLTAYVASSGGPPPPSVQLLWIVALVGIVIGTTIAWWVDQNRTLEAGVAGQP